MVSKTNEEALERTIERILTGTTREELHQKEDDTGEPLEHYRTGNGYYIGAPKDFDKTYAIDTFRFWHFLESSQPKEIQKLKRYPDYKLKILQRFDRTVKKEGILQLLRKGLKVEDASFELLYPPPVAGNAASVAENFEQNEFSVTRQVHYNSAKPGESIDMVIFINGIPVITLELKNASTHQTARVQGIRQYKQDRDHRQPLLQFGRCVVHFAVDTDEVYMCTKLAGSDSVFLPFNKGHNNGKGNPPEAFGHRTNYLWHDILKRESLADILLQFVRFEKKNNAPLPKQKLIFPRYHQLDVVRQLLDHAAKNGVGHSYLIQHSAGSGKSNSITWAAFQLIATRPEHAGLRGAKSTEDALFDSVVVVTDRRLLDKQLRENIGAFSQVKNLVAAAHSSSELREHLQNGRKIIITTIQKFPHILDGIADLSDKQFAVIIDEAHSSQSGTAAGKMNQAMGIQGDDDEEDGEDGQDKILKALRARKMKGNASYFAFTATPKNATLERFGTPLPDGSFKAFHLYAMKQAIEEGFILDVLANYTTYRSYYEIQKSIEENPAFDTRKAQKKLRAFVERDKRTIATKAEVMLEHFMQNVYNTKKLKGKAKGMVVTSSIPSAIRYYQALNKLLREKGQPFKIAIAFSGKKTVDGIAYTESEMNGFALSKTKEQFNSPDYRLLVVANKYLTGFDQPKLCAMYVDKKLQGVLAVQALSRLNRAANDLGKRTEDLFVLDFFNQTEDIQKAFEPYYTSTTLSEATDVNVLHELKDALDETGIYEWSEVEQFTTLYFDDADAQLLSPITDTAAERFNHTLELDDTIKADYKIKAKQFVKIYGQMASIIPYEIVAWEKLFWFLKFLIPKMKVKTNEDEAIDALLESVDLSTYGLQRTKVSQSLTLTDEEAELLPQNPNMRGAPNGPEEVDVLDEIIRAFNEKWFQGWSGTPEEQRAKMIQLGKALHKHPEIQANVLENTDQQNREIAMDRITRQVLFDQRRKDNQIYKLFKDDESFRQAFIASMLRLLDNNDQLFK